MEAISRHSPIPHSGPIYSTYGNGPYRVRVYRTCCTKGSKAKSTASQADQAHRGTVGFCLPVLAARHDHQRFPICTQTKRGLPIIPSRTFKTYGCGLAQLIIKTFFWEGRVEGLPLCSAP